MPDVQELSAADMGVMERMMDLPDDVLGLDEKERPDPKEGRPRDPDAIEAVDELPDVEAADADEVAAKTGEDGDAAEGIALDAEIEIADPEGGEPQRVKIADLLEAQKELTAFKDRQEQIIEETTGQAREAAQGMVRQVREWAGQTRAHLEAALQLIQPPSPPDIQMLNPQSANYDPERYMLAKAQHESVMGQFDKVRQHAQGLLQMQQQLAERASEEADSREIAKLEKAWPEFVRDDATRNGFIQSMGKHYGLTPQELDASMSDHRAALVMRDALKWREQESKGGTLRARVVEKAPAKSAPSETGQRKLSTEQASHMNARKALKANGKDLNAAAKAFMKFV